MKNIEIKAECKDLKKVENILKTLNADFLNRRFQRDMYFKTPKGKLKIRETDVESDSLIFYKRRKKLNPKKSFYFIYNTENSSELKEVLKEAFRINVIVEKLRKVYLFENVRIHLDNVKNLGNFIELEAVISKNDDEKKSRKNIDFLMEKLCIKKEDLMKDSYSDMLLLLFQKK